MANIYTLPEFMNDIPQGFGVGRALKYGVIHQTPIGDFRLDRHKMSILLMTTRLWYAQRGKKYTDVKFGKLISKLLISSYEDQKQGRKLVSTSMMQLEKLFNEVLEDRLERTRMIENSAVQTYKKP